MLQEVLYSLEFIDRELYKNKFGIYGIINVISGDVYVGQTCQRFEKRYWHHQWKLKDNTHDNQYLQNAYNLYGDKYFLFIVIKVVDDVNDLDDLEIKYINIYRDLNHCYNIINGGTDGHKGFSLSEEHKRKIGEKNRANMIGRTASEETKRKMSEVKKGKIHNADKLTISFEQAAEIKKRLINGDKPAIIAKDMDIPYKTVNGIMSNNTYKSIYVDGWDDFYNNRKTYNRLTKEDHAEIYRLHVQEGKTKQELAHMYNRTDKMIAKIFREQENY